MTTCIITVLKNEHEYLDEWIKYHLNLGINHIFIFEDIDSLSHQEITSKYNNVSLNSVFEIFNNNKERVLDMKKNERYYLNRYFSFGIKYIKDKFPNLYDWCFAIDNDEFITFEDLNKTFDDILSIYNGYDAFMLQWKCYGANELIYKPDYSDKGLIETYTKEAQGALTNSDIGFTKTCYNLNTYDQSFFWNVHQPTDKCKWCKSNLQSYRMRPIFNNIYIRHYITKSWEEYVLKIKVRGDILEGNRTYDDFFNLNPEMNDKKELLIELADKIINK